MMIYAFTCPPQELTIAETELLISALRHLKDKPGLVDGAGGQIDTVLGKLMALLPVGHAMKR